MAKARKAFVDVDGASRALAAFAKGFEFPKTERDFADIASDTAQSAWLKAISRRHAGIADAYHQWASANVPKMAKNARYVINQAQFDQLVRRTGIDLIHSWREGSTRPSSCLSFGETYRIIDLLFMAIDESARCRLDSIRQFLHVPLGGTTLVPLRPIIGELHAGEFALEIPATIPAGYVATEEQYILLQKAVAALARRAAIPPILYAYWCEQA